jgi:hypothetical protein
MQWITFSEFVQRRQNSQQKQSVKTGPIETPQKFWTKIMKLAWETGERLKQKKL